MSAPVTAMCTEVGNTSFEDCDAFTWSFGCTHLMDATPVTLGQEFGGYARQVRLGIERVRSALPRVAEVPLGGTAVGTGINTPAGFPQLVIELLQLETELPITEAADHFEAQANRDGLVEASGALRTIAVSLTKICNDIRWMGSGPNTGLGELQLPDLQPGSSIMPGKVNPVIPEAVLMVCARVIGAGVLVLVGFVLWQRHRGSDALLPLTLFHSRNFSLSNVCLLYTSPSPRDS